jgi:hypothetical protein
MFCSSTCGPASGCQCTGCKRIDELACSINSNSDLARKWWSVTHGEPPRFRYYCGEKSSTITCNECVDVCGPFQGCQCSSCEELTVMANTVAIQINAENRLCKLSYDNFHHFAYRTYCGGPAETCSGCTDSCGPYYGCQCSSCAKLDST